MVARGQGCIPVQEVRDRGCDGNSYGWEVWKEEERMEEGQGDQVRAKGDNRQGPKRPSASGARRMIKVA